MQKENEMIEDEDFEKVTFLSLSLDNIEKWNLLFHLRLMSLTLSHLFIEFYCT